MTDLERRHRLEERGGERPEEDPMVIAAIAEGHRRRHRHLDCRMPALRLVLVLERGQSRNMPELWSGSVSAYR
jgi:hypothetical protein